MPESVLFCWSGGKDSAMALRTLLPQSEVRVCALLTTVTEGYERVSMHGVRRELLRQQTEAIGLPLYEVCIPSHSTNVVYEARMEIAFRRYYELGTRRVVFGDIFLEDLREYREKNLSRMGMTAMFPNWKRDTGELAAEFCSAGFRGVVVCVDGKVLDRSFAGRQLDEVFFRDLPKEVDPCGENGEFHTLVYDGPIFKHSVNCKIGEIVQRDSFFYCDLIPERKAGEHEGE